MAIIADRLEYNVAGRFYVDSSCIDCDQCRVQAPDFFGRDPETGTSYVKRQPDTADDVAPVSLLGSSRRGSARADPSSNRTHSTHSTSHTAHRTIIAAFHRHP